MTPRQFHIAVAALFAIAAVLWFTHLGDTALRVNAEIRAHEITRTMIETGDYLMPYYEGDERVNKPPLLYWVSIVSARLTGEFTLFDLRIPSVLSALGLLGIVLAWTRLLGMPRGRSLLAMGLFLAMYDVTLHARRGGFEMLMSFFAAATVYACARAAMSDRPRPWGYAALAGFALGFLTKATPMLLVVPAVVAPWLVMAGRGRELRRPRVWVMSAVALLIGLSWHIFAIMFSEEVREHILGAALLPFGVKTAQAVGATHYEPPWFFLVTVWKTTVPVCFLLPLAALFVWRRRGFEPSSPWRLLLLAVVVPFVGFSLLPQKRDDYILPTYPYLVLITAQAVAWGLEELRGRARLLVTVPPVLVGAVMGVFVLVGPIGLGWAADWPLVAAALFGLAMAGALAALVRAMRARRVRTVAAAAFAGIALVWWWYFGVIRYYEDGFGSGHIWAQPGFDTARWKAKFERSPVLNDLLDVESGLERLQKDRFERTGRTLLEHVRTLPPPPAPTDDTHTTATPPAKVAP